MSRSFTILSCRCRRAVHVFTCVCYFAWSDFLQSVPGTTRRCTVRGGTGPNASGCYLDTSTNAIKFNLAGQNTGECSVNPCVCLSTSATRPGICDAPGGVFQSPDNCVPTPLLVRCRLTIRVAMTLLSASMGQAPSLQRNVLCHAHLGSSSQIRMRPTRTPPSLAV